MNQKETLEILNKEKDYEDMLAHNLMIYFLESIDDIKELDEKTKQTIKEILMTIAQESKIHSQKFSELIEMVLNNGETQY